MVTAITVCIALQYFSMFLVSNLPRMFSDSTVVRVYDARLARDSGRYVRQLKSFMPYQYTSRGGINENVDGYGAFQFTSVPLFFESDKLINFTIRNREALYQLLLDNDQTLARQNRSLSSPQREAIDIIFELHNTAFYHESYYSERIHLTHIIPSVITSFIIDDYNIMARLSGTSSRRDETYRALHSTYKRAKQGHRLSQSEATHALNVIGKTKGFDYVEDKLKSAIIIYLTNKKHGLGTYELSNNVSKIDFSGMISHRFDTEDGVKLTRAILMAPSWEKYQGRLREVLPNLPFNGGRHIVGTAIRRGSASFIEFIESPQFAEYLSASSIKVAPDVLADSLRYIQRQGQKLLFHPSTVTTLIEKYPPFRSAMAKYEFNRYDLAISDTARERILNFLIIPWLALAGLILMLVMLTALLTVVATDKSSRCYHWGGLRVGVVIFVMLFALAGTNMNAALVERFQNNQFFYYGNPDPIATALLNWQMSFLAKFPMM